jgi:hypothetical protein
MRQVRGKRPGRIGLLLLGGALAWQVGNGVAWAAPEPAGSHPHIYSLSKTYVRVGQQITLRGIDFGPTAPVKAGTGVLFNYNRTRHTGMRATVVSWSNTTIVCTVPGVGGTVRVSEVGVVTDRHVAHAGAPPSPDPGATTETVGTPGMGDRVQVVIARAPYQITARVLPTVTLVRPTGYGADPAGQARWGDTLRLTVELRFTLAPATYAWSSWGTYNNNKPVYLYLMGPDVDPRAPGYEARWEGRLQSYVAKFPAAIDRVERIGTGDNHRIWISNFSAPVSSVAKALCIGPYRGNDGRWGWNDRVRDDMPWTPGEWRLVGLLIPETLYYQNTSGAVVAVDTHASTVTTFTGRRIALDNTWGDATEDPYVVTILHPLDLRVSADGGANWDSFGPSDTTSNGNRRLIPAPPVAPAGTVPRLWFSTPIPEVQAQPDPGEGALPGQEASLWSAYGMLVVNQSHVRLGPGSFPAETGGPAVEVPEFGLAPFAFPADPDFYAGYPNSDFPSIPAGSVAAEMEVTYAGGNARCDATTHALNLPPVPPSPPPGNRVGIAEVRDMSLTVPVNQPSLAAVPLSNGGSQPASYATTATCNTWTGAPVDPQPSLGVPGDYTLDEARLYDRYLAKAFVNSDGSRDEATGALTADLGNIGPLVDLSTVDVANAEESLLGFWNLQYAEALSPDPFGWLYEEAYRSFILSLSVRESYEMRLSGMGGAATILH